jgi:integrase
MTSMATDLTGITTVHRATCSVKRGAKRCTCSPSYRVQIRRGERSTVKTFTTIPAAQAWRAEQLRRLRFGREMQAPYTVGEALDRFLADLESGVATNRSGEPFKPGNVIGYRQTVNRYLRGALNGRLVRIPISDLSPVDVAGVADEIVERGLSASTVRNAMMPLRVVVRREIRRGVLDRNPFVGVTMPAVRGRRDRFATREEASILLGVLDDPTRAFYAAAFYAGLRSGEISALRWEDVDTAAREIRVRASYCSRSGQMTAPKSQAANRVVPMQAALGSILDTYRADLAASEGAERIAPRTLVFSGATGQPLRGTTVTTAARKEWAARDLTPIGLHEARHTYASLSAAAGIRIEDLSEFMGHTSLNMTYKRYRHLYPEARIEARERLDAYLAAATTVPTVSLIDECDD